MIPIFISFLLSLRCILISAYSLFWFPVFIYPFVFSTFLSPRSPNFSSYVQCRRTPFSILLSTLGINLSIFTFPVQLFTAWWGQKHFSLYCPSLTGMSLSPFHLPLLVWLFLHLILLVPCKLCVTTLWLGTWRYQTSSIHMNGWGSIGPVLPICSWFVVILWCPPSPFPYLCSILHAFVVSYTAITVPPLGYSSVCLHVYNFSWSFSCLILSAWTHGGNWCIYQPFLHKCSSALICGVVGMSLSVRQNYLPLLYYFTVHFYGFNMISYIGSLCNRIIS